MKFLIFCFILCILACLGFSKPTQADQPMVIRPKIFRRSPQKYGVVNIKGQPSGGRIYNPTPPPELNKGEYVCGNKVCRLKPGQIPKGCNGVCQYRV